MSDTTNTIDFFEAIKKAQEIKTDIDKNTPRNFYQDIQKTSSTLRKLATLYILLKNAVKLDPKEGAGKNLEVYDNAIKYVKGLNGEFKISGKGSSSSISIEKILSNLAKYVNPPVGITASEEEIKKTMKDYPNFTKLINSGDNIDKLEKLYNSINRDKSSEDVNAKKMIRNMVKNALGGKDTISLDDISKNKIAGGDGKEKTVSDNSQNDTSGLSDTEKEMMKELELSDKEENAIVTHESPYNIFTGFDYSLGRMLKKLRANRHYDFAEEMEYFNKNIDEFAKFKQKIEEDIKKYPAREDQYRKVLNKIPKHLRNIEKLKQECKETIDKLTDNRYLSRTDWGKYTTIVLKNLGKLNIEAAEMEREYYAAGRPTREEMNAVRKEIKAKAHDEWLVNHVWGREVVKKWQDWKENSKYKNFIEKIKTVMPEEEIEKLIDEYTNAFNTRDEYDRIDRKAREKMWQIEKKVKSVDSNLKLQDILSLLGLSKEQQKKREEALRTAGEYHEKEFDAKGKLDEIKKFAYGSDAENDKKKMNELLDDIAKTVGTNSSIYKEGYDIINKKEGIVKKTLKKIDKKIHPDIIVPETKEEPKKEEKKGNNNEMNKKPENKESVFKNLQTDPEKNRIMDIMNELKDAFDRYKKDGEELNRRKVLRLLTELKNINPAQHRIAQTIFEVPKSTEDSRIESNISRFLKNRRRQVKTIPGKFTNSVKNISNKVKEWAQKQIDKQYERKPKKMNEDIATTIGLVTGAIVFYTSLAAAVAWGTSLAITSYGIGLTRVAKSIKNMWKKLGKEFTEEEVTKKAKKMVESKEAQKTIEKIDKIEDKYYDELRDIYRDIEEKNWDEAAEDFKELPSNLQSNLDILKAIINKISAVNEEPPLYINSPGNTTYQAIKKIIGIKVARSAAEAVRKAID